MRDPFDPLAPLLHQSHQHPTPDPHSLHGRNMQGQFHMPSKPSFGNGFGAVGFSSAVGEKRSNCSDENENENVDCNLLQSSLKRVRLSRSPGEFRLQRDLKTLNATQWGSIHASTNALNYSSTTWIHRSTGTRLTMVDSLRICLFLPLTAMQASGQYTSDVDPKQRYQHQTHSYHRDYRWRIMIQIPRMYPHNPPVVTRIDGLALGSITINEMPPNAHHRPLSSNDSRGTNEIESASVHSNRGVTNAHETLFFTETQLARSQSSGMTSTETQGTTSALSMLNGMVNSIEWNQWSPIAGLGELLEFLMHVAESNPATGTTGMNTNGTGTTTNSMAGTQSFFQPSMAVTTGRMSSCSSSSLSSVSSASSYSSWGTNRNNNPNQNENRPFHHRASGNNTVAADTSMMTDENATTTSNVSGASFLSPNRFDVGYGKSGGFAPGTTPRTANTSAAWQQQIPYYQGKQGDEDIGMDMS